MTKIKKILLVDDDDITNLLHSRLISRTGLVETIDVVTDGDEALAYLEREMAAGNTLPELVFLDINMPRMGGFEFLAKYAALNISNDLQQVIVMLSTSLLEADHDRAEADPNVKCFANKPIATQDFVEIVTMFINARTGTCNWDDVHRRISAETRSRSMSATRDLHHSS